MRRVIKRNIKFKIIFFILIGILIGITSNGTYAYFTDGDKYLPSEDSGNPVYNTLTISYTDHTENSVVDDGVTIYFDTSSLLPGWNAPTFYYYVTNLSGTELRNNGWAYTATKRVRFDSVKTVNPTDLSKASTVISTGGTLTSSSGLGGITWSGTWVKIKVKDANFDITSSEKRYVIIHVGNDQTANNIQISSGVREVYIKGAVIGTGGSSTRDWKKLEIRY